MVRTRACWRRWGYELENLVGLWPQHKQSTGRVVHVHKAGLCTTYVWDLSTLIRGSVDQEITGPKQRVVTRAEALELREKAWSARLASVSLAAEVKVDPGHAAQMMEILGSYYRKYPNDPYRRVCVLRAHPAVQVLATTNAAIEKYDARGLWPKLADLLQISNTQVFQQEWGQAFLDNLTILKLPTFANAEDDAGTKYLGRILLHCGVPTKCLGDYYRIIAEQRAKNPNIDAETFVSWAIGRAEADRLYNVDMPVNRFLRFGGEFAIDVTERVFELLDNISAGGDGRDISLPERFRLKALEMKQEGAFERVQSRGGHETKGYPHLVVDPYGRGPMLRLPPIGDIPDGRATWIVTLDGDPQRVATESGWPGSAESSQVTNVPIPRPIRTASVALQGHENLTANVLIVDDNDPFLAFDEDGVGLASGIALPNRPIWLLVPGPSNDLVFDGEVKIIAETALPPGWTQWSLTLVDLTNVHSVRFGNSRPHTVRNYITARIDVGQPVVGVRTSDGAPVFARLPEIILPDGVGFDTPWEVLIFDSRNQFLHRTTVENGRSLWSELTHPLLGSYTIRVRGPWGRGASRTIFIAEGLVVTSNPAWRRLTADGLVPATVSIGVPQGMEAADGSIFLGPRESSCYTTLHTTAASVSVQLSPPHMSIAYQSTETTTKASLSAVTLFTEDVLSSAGTLILTIGAEAEPVITVFAGSQSVQTLFSTAGRQGIYRFNLSQLVDTLAVHKYLVLTLGSEGQLPVASIRPRQLFSTVVLAPEGLVFWDCASIPGMVALVYATRAPWRQPIVLPITQGRSPVPHELHNAGPLLITVRVEDPWTPEPVPAWPESARCRFVDAPGWLRSEDGEESALSAFLAGFGELPSEISDFTRLWSTRAAISDLGLGDHEIMVRREIEAALHRQAQEALGALVDSSVPTEMIPVLIIRTGLAWADLAGNHTTAAPIWTMRGALPAALLSAADAEWSQEEIDAASEVCGDAVQKIIQGRDPYAASGRFDRAADIYARNPAQREAIVALLGLVPQGLLGRDTRVMASMELSRHLGDKRLEALFQIAHSVSASTGNLLKNIAPSEIVAAFQARKSTVRDSGWYAIPTISLGLAIVARYAARGNELAVRFIKHLQGTLKDLAEVVPQLVTIDLILAELLVAGAEARRKD